MVVIDNGESVARVDPITTMRNYMAQHGMKNSRQRETIAEVFFEAARHMSVDDILEAARQVDSRVSQATVYRTMKLLTECGLAEARHFNDGQALYEVGDILGHHHDHLICIDCGKIVEFVDERIEELQTEIATKYGFELTQHRMELYGRCGDPQCRERGN